MGETSDETVVRLGVARLAPLLLLVVVVGVASADEGFDGTYPTNVVVKNNGTCLYVPPGIFKSTCKIDITWFPFDDQRCEMKFGSWTYDGFQLDLQLQDESGGDISSFITNGEWDLLDDYTTLQWDYFLFPGVTILLSLTVFLNMVAETMPATSDAVPLLGTYFNCIMFMVASSVVSTILILNYHHRNSDTHEMSEWVITDQLRSDEENTKVTNDWKFAAMVIDRMCLIIFTLFTIIATITVLLSAPHIIVT
ncbi:hypothetical protein M0804_005479 [Polistes exclamans]|nr:hypothetical protein M0804_005479 [Polistes exclamans]